MAVPRELLLGLMPIRFASLVPPLDSENCTTPHRIMHQKIDEAVVFKTESFGNLINLCLFICLYRFMGIEKYKFWVHAAHMANMNEIIVSSIDQDRRITFCGRGNV